MVRLDNVSAELGVEVWAKLEENCGAWGGNKLRKLEYILAEAERRRAGHLVSYGAGGSNWTTALALHAPRHGFGVTVVLETPPPDRYAALYRSAGTRVVITGRPRLGLAMLGRRHFGAPGRVWTLPIGGSGTTGDRGSIHTGEEVGRAVTNGEMPEPRAVYVAVGTAGTAAGVAVGMGAAGTKAPVIAVRVADLPFGSTALVRYRIRHMTRRFGDHWLPPAPIEGESGFVKPGYAKPNAASRAAERLAARDGLTLDPTYAAKAFAALVAAARAGRPGPYLFVHTSPGPVPTSATAP